MTLVPMLLATPEFFIYPPLLFIIGSFVAFVLSTLRPKAFPPGPRGLPGLGNLLQIDRIFPFLTYSDWSKIYGKDTPLGIKKGGLNVVVLNSGRLVRELVERRGAVYNDRPWQFMNDTWVFVDGLKPAIFRNPGTWLSRWRKEFNNNFGTAAIAKSRSVYEAETAKIIVKLLRSAGATRVDLEDLLVVWVASVSCLGACGRRLDGLSETGFKVKEFRRVSDEYVTLVAPNLMDLFPFLRYLPEFLGMAAWKEKARACREGVINVGNQFLEAATEQRAALDAGKPVLWESIVSKMLREKNEKNENMYTATDMGNTAFHITSASTNTSLASVSTMLMVLAKYPEIQQRARAEVLEVSGGAMPRATDLPNMKYLDAFWNESHRWRPVAPQAVPHAPSQDDIYEGRRIPKGTAVTMNVWQIHHDEEDYEDPEKFIPERFVKHPYGMRLDEAHDPANMESTSTRVTYDFGAGRRICPGQNSAKANLLLGMAKMIWAFDIMPPVGREIDLSMKTGYVQGIALHPKHLDVSLRLREGVTEKEIMDHYYQSYEAEAQVMGWENGIYREI